MLLDGIILWHAIVAKITRDSPKDIHDWSRSKPQEAIIDPGTQENGWGIRDGFCIGPTGDSIGDLFIPYLEAQDSPLEGSRFSPSQKGQKEIARWLIFWAEIWRSSGKEV